MMFLVGLSGQKQAGKDTIADCIKVLLKGRKVLRLAFADELKRECAIATGCTVEFMEQHKDVFRPLWQWWGTEFRRGLHGDTYWIERWLRKVSKAGEDTYCVVTTDVRFKNEADMIREAGGIVIRVARQRAVKVDDKHLSENDLTDGNYPYNFLVRNDGTLSDLRSEVHKLIRLCGMAPFTA